MIGMLVAGYVFAIRSERLLRREVQVNLAYRWFRKLGIEDAIPHHSAFSRARNERFREGDVFRRVVEPIVRLTLPPVWWAVTRSCLSSIVSDAKVSATPSSYRSGTAHAVPP